MSYTTTITSKRQLTIPKAVFDQLGIKLGQKVTLYPVKDGFIGKPLRKSRILDFAGDLVQLDKGEPLSEIREKTQALAAKEVAKKLI